jgi:hypothetical protein
MIPNQVTRVIHQPHLEWLGKQLGKVGQQSRGLVLFQQSVQGCCFHHTISNNLVNPYSILTAFDRFSNREKVTLLQNQIVSLLSVDALPYAAYGISLKPDRQIRRSWRDLTTPAQHT